MSTSLERRRMRKEKGEKTQICRSVWELKSHSYFRPDSLRCQLLGNDDIQVSKMLFCTIRTFRDQYSYVINILGLWDYRATNNYHGTPGNSPSSIVLTVTPVTEAPSWRQTTVSYCGTQDLFMQCNNWTYLIACINLYLHAHTKTEMEILSSLI